MFTGIIEAFGTIRHIEPDADNIRFTIDSAISEELKIDQSVAHNGVCLTVVELGPGSHTVTAIEETLKRSNLGSLTTGSKVNLERAMKPEARLDGHIVQGHVDTVGTCTDIVELNGSWQFSFEYDLTPERLLVDKGSICVNGVSLTVVSPSENGDRGTFTVAIIPYTYEHTNFHQLQIGSKVNLEFDVIGKYVAKYLKVFGKNG
ncbi:MAG: riboflavin synthase [Saprospirales bacterium]|nr:riboflavin synthase [Saprospirales bacterium]